LKFKRVICYRFFHEMRTYDLDFIQVSISVRGFPLTPKAKAPQGDCMAIYHCSTKTVNRSSGRTAVASSAYRAGEKLEDERTGLTHDFTRKDGVAHSEILSNLDIEIDRAELWNLAEKTENRKDARTAREWVIALPDELDADQRKDLAKEFARSLVDRYDVIADLAIHEPSKGGNDKNHHAHIMLTTRKAELDTDNKLTLTTKTDIELSNAKRKSLGMGTTQEDIKQIRETWADLANKALERAGYREKIDHRSYADQNNGLSASQAFKLFLTQVAETNKIPLSFDYAETENVPNSVTRKALTEAKNRTDFSDAYETPEEFMKAMQELANA
jgi:antitoxin component of RelBE/YafQ-DinJ toxin-antitoxin module